MEIQKSKLLTKFDKYKWCRDSFKNEKKTYFKK